MHPLTLHFYVMPCISQAWQKAKALQTSVSADLSFENWPTCTAYNNESVGVHEFQ